MRLTQEIALQTLPLDNPAPMHYRTSLVGKPSAVQTSILSGQNTDRRTRGLQHSPPVHLNSVKGRGRWREGAGAGIQPRTRTYSKVLLNLEQKITHLLRSFNTTVLPPKWPLTKGLFGGISFGSMEFPSP